MPVNSVMSYYHIAPWLNIYMVYNYINYSITKCPYKHSEVYYKTVMIMKIFNHRNLELY